MKLIPRGKRYIIRKDIPDEQSGTIYIPENARTPAYTGIIIKNYPIDNPKGTKGIEAVDELLRLSKLRIEQGKRVVFHKHAGVEVIFDHAKLFIVREEDILAIVESDGE